MTHKRKERDHGRATQPTNPNSATASCCRIRDDEAAVPWRAQEKRRRYERCTLRPTTAAAAHTDRRRRWRARRDARGAVLSSGRERRRASGVRAVSNRTRGRTSRAAAPSTADATATSAAATTPAARAHRPNENSRLARGSGLLPTGVRRASPPASGGRACHASNSARSGVRVLSVNAARRVASERSVFRSAGA